MTRLAVHGWIALELLLLSAVFSACSSSDKNDEVDQAAPKTNTSISATNFTVPELADRKVQIGPPEELDQLLDAYDQALLDIQADPNNLRAYLRIAEVFIQESRVTGEFGYNLASALSVLDHVISVADNQRDALFEALTYKAIVKLSQHQFQEALGIGKEALGLNDRNSGIYGVLVDANVELGEYEKAVEMSDKMVSIRPDLRSYSRISYLREIHGDIEGAIDAMKMAVSAGYPGFERTCWCRVVLGGLYEKNGDLTNAEFQYRMAIEERNDYPYALAALGALEFKKSNYIQAVELLEKAISIIPDAGFHAQLSKCYTQLGEDDKAHTAQDEAFTILMGHSNSHHDHSHHHEHAHDHDSGSGHTHNHGHGHSHEVGLEMARMYLEFTDNVDKVLENALHEYALRPKNIEVNKVLATAYYITSDFTKARFHLQQANRTSVFDPELLCLAGLLEISDGAESKGRELIGQSFATNPYQDHVLVSIAQGYL